MDFVKISYDLGVFVGNTFGIVYGIIGIAWPIVGAITFTIGWYLGRAFK